VNWNVKHPLYGVFHQLHNIRLEAEDQKKSLSSGWSILGVSREEKKLQGESDPVSASAVSLASNLLSSNEVYTFILRSAASISASNVPTLLSYINWDPSGLSEWTSISALFTEARLVRCRVFIQGTNTAGVAGQVPTILIGSQPALNTVTPTGTSSVMNTADCKLFSPSIYALEHPFTHSSPMRPNKLWAPIAAPASQVDAGTYGQFSLVAPVAAALVASAQYLEVLIEYEVEVRARA